MAVVSLPVRLAALALTAATLAAPALAADTLEKIRQTRSITIGNRESARPFSFLDADKRPVGYSVELCQRVVESIKRELKMPDLKVNYLTVAGAERIPKLVAGAIDLECGSTTNTRARQEQVDFSYTFFVAGMKILSSDAALTSPQALAGKKVALSKGTTSEKLFSQLREAEVGTMQLVSFPSNGDALKALQAGQVAAFPQDDVLLQGMLSTIPDAQRYRLGESYLSVEPYGIMVRKGDAALLSLVDRTLSQLYASGEINAIYARWFDSPTLKVPMSSLLRDSIMRPSKQAAFALILGHTL
ncbi:amino acid ABC transporter substrate-binding protein [Uliginosibacterium sp. H1]|uniref:amino acid ABC transporter substrate-binding protein n=1 Tax=Uliginosibacterium sp. H1 TaxID=3114757 RepID=UPI002E16C1E0|nr:amino acid ABC transporter substrate-binding protein [Uliginosibacterium sp. H1]